MKTVNQKFGLTDITFVLYNISAEHLSCKKKLKNSIAICKNLMYLIGNEA